MIGGDDQGLGTGTTRMAPDRARETEGAVHEIELQRKGAESDVALLIDAPRPEMMIPVAGVQKGGCKKMLR